jgi:asparagine synthase (glutamine-hydrolysing)
VASLYGTRHEDFIVENPFEKLSEQIEIVGEPRGNLYTAFLFDKVAEDGCDLLLTGDGGDELFGGYAFRYERAMQGSTFGPSDYMDAHERDWVPDQTTLIPNLDWNRIYAYLNQSLNAPLPRLGRVFLADFNGKLLHDFQPTNAAFAQHYKIRTESPFLQPELIYAASHLPYNLKYDPVNKIGKLLLRNILLLRSGFQPAVRPKIGFGMDLAWMWDHHLREICETHLKNSKLNLVGINTGWLPHGFSEADKHDLRYITKMLGLLAIQLWLEA